MPHILEADGIALHYGTRAILTDIYINATTGEITALAGNNGTGKSSLLKIIFGVLKPESCSVRIDGKHTPAAYKNRFAISYLPQHHIIPGWKTTQQVLNDFSLSFNDFQNTFDTAIKPGDRIREMHGSNIRLLEIFITVRQPVLFALLDEPFTHLSPILSEQVQCLLIAERARKGIIVTDHNFHYIKDISDRIYLLDRQRLRHIKDFTERGTYQSMFEL